MLSKKRISIMLMVIVLSLVLMSVSSAIMAQEVNIKFGTGSPMDPYDASGAGAMYFEHYVENESNGEIEVDIYPANQLGTNDEMLEQVKRGTIQMATSMGSGQLAAKYYPNFYMFDIPYLFKNAQAAWEVVKPSNPLMSKMMDDMAEKTNVRPLSFYVEGSRHFTNDVRPITKPEDMEGLKIRTMTVEAHMEMVKALGASPTPIAYSELYGAMQTGVVDGQENPIGNIDYLKAYEVQDYLVLDGHITYMVPAIINEDFFRGLSEEHQEIVRKGALEFARVNNTMAKVGNMEGLKNVKENGMTVTTLDSEGLQAFRDKTQPVVIEFVREQVEDPELIEELLAEIEKNE
jgi:tripartite ATP-independent transporter DctP family solute receptor